MSYREDVQRIARHTRIIPITDFKMISIIRGSFNMILLSTSDPGLWPIGRAKEANVSRVGHEADFFGSNGEAVVIVPGTSDI
jgi:hypothetical protein